MFDPGIHPLSSIFDERHTVLVAGYGVSGRSCQRLLHRLGVDTLVCDSREELAPTVRAAGARYLTPEAAEAQLSGIDMVVTSPGWRPDAPVLRAAARAGVPVVTDVDVAFYLDRSGRCGTPSIWLAITGTNGKTTTTGMVEAIMRRHSGSARAMGNIGVALCDAVGEFEYVVAELSSFQLHWSHNFTPDCGCLLNLADDHLDWHGGFDDYARAKARVLQGKVSVVGIDDPVVEKLSSRATGSVVGFTLTDPQPGQVGVRDGWIVDRVNLSHDHADAEGVRVMPVADVSPVGTAGLLDALAATAIARTQNVPVTTISAALSEFTVAKHRGQVVYQWNDVTCIDNSKATNPHAADAALAGLDNIIWVAGGQLKGANIEELVAQHAPRLTAVALLGVDAPSIADAVRRYRPDIPLFVSLATDPAVAMDEVCGFAVAQARPGSTIALAPAAASLDMYTGMAQRGDMFAASLRRASAACVERRTR